MCHLLPVLRFSMFVCYIYTCPWWCLWADTRATSRVVFDQSLILETVSFTGLSRLGCSTVQWSFILCIHSMGWIGMAFHSQPFTWTLESEVWCSCLDHMCSCLLNHFPRLCPACWLYSLHRMTGITITLGSKDLH